MSRSWDAAEVATLLGGSRWEAGTTGSVEVYKRRGYCRCFKKDFGPYGFSITTIIAAAATGSNVYIACTHWARVPSHQWLLLLHGAFILSCHLPSLFASLTFTTRFLFVLSSEYSLLI